MDNVFVERLWRSVKQEEVYLHDYGSMREVIEGLRRYFQFYNHERCHQSLDYQTPHDVHHNNGSLTPAKNHLILSEILS